MENTVINYFTELDIIQDIEKELLQLDEMDMEMVLSVILPEGTDLELAVRDLKLWQQQKN